MEVDVEGGAALGLINPRQGPNLPGGPAAERPLVLQSVLVRVDGAGPVRVEVVDNEGTLAYPLLAFDAPASAFSDRRWIVPAGFQLRIRGPRASVAHVLRLNLWQFADDTAAQVFAACCSVNECTVPIPTTPTPGGGGLPTTPDPGGPGEQKKVSIELPEGYALDDVLLHATGGELRVDDGVALLDGAGGHALSVNAGPALTQINAGANVGDIVAGGSVHLGSRCHVHGSVVCQGQLVVQDGVVIDGEQRQQKPIVMVTVFRESMTFPANNAGDRFTESTNLTLEPGVYARVSARNGHTLTLRPGVYRMEHFELEPSGHIVIDNATAPVLVFVRQSMFWRAASQTLSGSPAAFKVTVFGASTLPFDGSFSGFLVAPNADVDLNPGRGGLRYKGKFFGRSVEAFPGGSVFERLALPPAAPSPRA